MSAVVKDWGEQGYPRLRLLKQTCRTYVRTTALSCYRGQFPIQRRFSSSSPHLLADLSVNVAHLGCFGGSLKRLLPPLSSRAQSGVGLPSHSSPPHLHLYGLAFIARFKPGHSISRAEPSSTIWPHDGHRRRRSADSDGYEAARVGRQFNRRYPNRYPEVVVKAKTESDIIEAVRLARKTGSRVALRSGGHSFPAWAVRDTSILIDLGSYHQIDVDEEKQTAQEYGLIFNRGHCPDVGIGGLLLRCGMGWNCQNWGWSYERLYVADVVTADGRLVHCNLDENSDLFWAARGAGPARLYQESINWVLKLTPTFDQSTEISAVGRYFHDSDEFCFSVFFVTMKDTMEEAPVALLSAQQTRPLGAIQEWFCKVDSLAQEYNNQEATSAGNRRYCTENAFIKNDADVLAVLKDAFHTLPSRQSAVYCKGQHLETEMKTTTGVLLACLLSQPTPANAALYGGGIRTKYGGSVQGYPAFSTTPAGNLTNWKNIAVWKGIPYAATTAGRNRSRSPQPASPWNGTLDAADFGNICPSTSSSPVCTFNEDCLSLSIWSAARSANSKLPVVMWSYPTYSTAVDALFGGAGMADKDVVYVNYNYRTSTFGWLAHPELLEERFALNGYNTSSKESTYNTTWATKFLDLYPAANASKASASYNLQFTERSIVGTWLWAHLWRTGPATSHVWTYMWDHAPPGQTQGAYHESEINYVLNNLYDTNDPWTAEDYNIAATMNAYWVNFIKTGNPNGPGLVHWPLASDKRVTKHVGDGWGSMPVATDDRVTLFESWFNTLTRF
ncbi:Alpha/Beta hydrolase protein [Dactylonectria macrodidyma]|uniref:Alpha/Beta hydrolase protein n=1 Tax=Dactylonectria macrodidyma TaxID=307937 RepID=A0A9P9FTB4_9HYPO|nr:Alpha/Beta hydrolase protein [Dactylonectria macrodidyma]